MSVRLYRLDVSEYADPGLFESAYFSLPVYRRRKIDRIVPEAEKRLSLGAGLLLARAMTDAGLDPDAEPALGANGKPFFPGTGFHYSLSHSGTVALCAVADREVGVDVEQMRETDFLKLARRFFAPEEYELIAAAKPPEENNYELRITNYELFFRIWTLKESFIKATGEGMSRPLGSFAVLPGADGIALLVDGKPETGHVFEEISDIPGCRAAICLKEDNHADTE